MKIQRNLIQRWLAGVALLTFAAVGHGAVYYVNAATGSDANVGTNPQAPLRTLARADQLSLRAGDQVLLAAGQTFAGQLAYENLAGTADRPIVISSYQPGSQAGAGPATIDARGYNAGVLLENCAAFSVGNLSITANGGGMKPDQRFKTDLRCGVLVVADAPGDFAGYTLTNVTVQDVFYEEPGFVRSSAETKTANGTQKYGWGIRFLNVNKSARLQNIRIEDCAIANVSHTGLQFTAPSNGVENVTVRHLRVTASGGPGVQMSGLADGRFTGLDVNGSGSASDSRNWKRGSGLWTWSCRDVVIEKSRFQNANGPGDSCGVHIDFNCRNVIVQYNLSAHNAGGFCEILGNNYNCAYRYNVSVNDGYRVKGRDGAFQEGKTFWLSGYTGDKSPKHGPFNTYFYNNTIFADASIVTKISVAPTASGVLIANNIFCLQGRSESVSGDQNRPDQLLSGPLPNVVFKNNLFLRPDNWPAGVQLQDQAPVIGDPDFARAGGLRLEDYVPANAKLVQNHGIPIPLIPGDAVGLAGGLKMNSDILGQPVRGNPDLGAIEVRARHERSIGL
jgi:hypothetical protein